MKKVQSTNSGQALVLVLLGLSVVLTVALFIVSRSVTDIAVSTSETQAVSAFSAAEAGVEQALVTGEAGSLVAVGSANYSSQISSVAQGASSFIYPLSLNSGESITLWLKSQDGGANFAGQNLKICWGKVGSTLKPAIEAVLFYGTKIYRAAFDPDSARNVNNSFTLATVSNCTVGGQTFPYQTTLSLAGLSNPQFMFVRMFYNTDVAQPLAFSSTDGTFPSQGILIDSSGTAGQSSRKVQVFQSWPEIPTIFQFAVYSSTGLTK